MLVRASLRKSGRNGGDVDMDSLSPYAPAKISMARQTHQKPDLLRPHIGFDGVTKRRETAACPNPAKGSPALWPRLDAIEPMYLGWPLEESLIYFI